MKLRFLILSIFTLFISSKLLAQPQTTLEGTIVDKKNKNIKYKLVFTMSEENYIRGYSIFDIGGPTETKMGIIGQYFPDKQLLNYRTISILNSKTDLSKEKKFYLIRANLNENIEDSKHFSGKFDGVAMYDDDVINSGLVDLEAPGEKKPKKENKLADYYPNNIPDPTTAITKPKPEPFVTPAPIVPKEEERPAVKVSVKDIDMKSYTSVDTVSQGDPLAYNWKGKKISIYVWDDDKYDGDEINIKLNGKVVVPHFFINKFPKAFTLELREGKNTLKIRALNNGKFPPNSAKIVLRSEANEQEALLSYNYEGEESVIYIYSDSGSLKK